MNTKLLSALFAHYRNKPNIKNIGNITS